jgi:hypothetical protein
MSYAESSPGQAAMSWHREFHFIEMRLREWTAFYGCSQQEHRAPIRSARPTDEEAWAAQLADQKRRREERELGA